MGSRLGNGWQKNDGKRVKKIIRNATDRDGGIVNTGQIIVLEQAFHEIQIQRQNEFIKKKKQRERPGILKNSFCREYGIGFVCMRAGEIFFSQYFVADETNDKYGKRSDNKNGEHGC